MKKLIVCLVLFSLLAGCPNLPRPANDGYKVEVISQDGKVVRSWKTYQVSCLDYGYMFVDRDTNEVVRVSGNVVITAFRGE